MEILFWTPPWPTQSGDLFFHKNAFEKHLLVQANTLAKSGCNVTVACPDSYRSAVQNLSQKAKVIYLNSKEAITLNGGFADPSPDLYRFGKDSEFSGKAIKWLFPQLGVKYDVIMIWENPVPFLETMFPEAVIVHQMPGAFARPPYPHMVTFDVNGLYRSGTLHTQFDDIVRRQPQQRQFTQAFREKVNSILEKYTLRSREDILRGKAASKIGLIPLQISDHYAFQVDTPYHNQSDFLIDVLGEANDDVAMIVTQYVHKLYRDQILDPKFEEFIKSQFNNVHYEKFFDTVPSVSQYLLPLVDELHIASSSLALQALCWDTAIHVHSKTQYEKLNNLQKYGKSSRDSVLDFVLGKNQVLASEVTQNAKTLTSILEQLTKQSRPSTVDTLPNISEINPAYNELVLNSFRQQEARNSLKAVGFYPEMCEMETPKKFRSELSNKKYELISFDLFDTLIERPLEAPADAYKLLEYELKGEGIEVPFDFATKRLKAELIARKDIKSEEITLEDIYAVFQRLFNVSSAIIETLQQRELDLELHLARPRRVGQECWQAAISTGVPICITSDMYLPGTHIRKILSKTGYSQAEIVYLSSELNKTKKTGNLFNHIAKDRGIPTSSILHVGDNLRTDINSAKEQGVATFHIPKSVDVMKRNPHYRHVFAKRQPIEDLPRSAIAWNLANRFFDDYECADLDTMTRGTPKDFGYAVLGPLIFGYVVWLRQEAIRQNIDALYFLSREGKLIKSIFDVLESIAPSNIRSVYLYGSRRAIRVPAIATVADILDVAANPFSEETTIGSLLHERFGIKEEELDIDLLKRFGFGSVKVKMTKNKAESFYQLATALSDVILKHAEQEKIIYLKYLNQMGFSESQRPAVVDIGWKANMQGAISQLLGRGVDGFYFATLQDAERWKDKGNKIYAYYAASTPITEHSPILCHRLFLEYFWCEGSPSVTSIREDSNGACVPVFNSMQEPPLRLELIERVHSGALLFAKALCDSFGPELLNRDFSPALVDRCMNQFIINPSKQDASIFEEHFFEDSFGGVSKGYLISPKSWNDQIRISRSYWKHGANALVGQQIDSKNHSFKRISMRTKLVLACVWPILKSDLNERESNEFHNEPWTLFGNAKDPAMIIIGRLAGLR
ncbi:hypothetical protein FIU93_27015 [Labrenzia sp. THAF35]|uniref:HAD family hydrolase n=1 Tax=Labrenzia sp. THAF35 TaxID=2587854 RepID=UPI001268A38A|nr:HAD-IA family hydrolase [Labrenzia sp. THAF35]QFT70467.1 hypothetical protein FIU93_27015 [Labrenzia sp. THAF35]